jgi:hypothetical protein
MCYRIVLKELEAGPLSTNFSSPLAKSCPWCTLPVCLPRRKVPEATKKVQSRFKWGDAVHEHGNWPTLMQPNTQVGELKRGFTKIGTPINPPHSLGKVILEFTTVQLSQGIFPPFKYSQKFLTLQDQLKSSISSKYAPNVINKSVMS